MVPTNEPLPWFGWVAQGWNITFLLSSNQRAGVMCPVCGEWDRADRTDTLLGPGTIKVVPQVTNPTPTRSRRAAAWGGVW